MGTDVAEAAKRGAGGQFRAKGPATFPKEKYASVSSSLSAAIAALKAPELIDKVLRSAAYAGAKVFYDELQQKVPVKKGVLKSSLYKWHDDKRSQSGKVQIYLVGPNKSKAGHWANVEFGHWRYNKAIKGKKGWMKSKKLDPAKTKSVKGTKHGGPGALDAPVWVPAHPYIRPTWEARKKAAVLAMQTRAMQRLREVLAGQD